MNRSFPGIVDPGLQPERTDHAWRRTGFSFLAVGGLILHTADGMSHKLGFLLSLPVLLFAVWVHKIGPARYRQASHTVHEHGVNGRVIQPRYLRIVALAVLTFQVFALVVGVNAHWRQW